MLRGLIVALALGCLAGRGGATVIVPSSDDQVIETLPAGANSAASRQLKHKWLTQRNDPALAVPLARGYLAEARASGDPRPAGQALAALATWSDPATAPLDVLLIQANVHQYLHDFDGAAALLQKLLQRDPRQLQALLTLATVRRVQGRYGESDRYCGVLLSLRASLYGSACLAENEALRGQFDSARARLQRLLGDPALAADSRNWLLTTLAELEQRAARPAAAEAAFKAALAAADDNYTLTSFADFLLEQHRPAAVLNLLGARQRTDAFLLRMSIAGAAIRPLSSSAQRDIDEMRGRIVQANLRPEAQGLHAREQAMFALWVDGDPARALELARHDVAKQREPIDVLVMAQSARAARQQDALREAADLRQTMGLGDRRLDALL